MPTSASPYHYEPEVLATIFRSVKTIAVVGASEQAHKASFSVIMHLQAYGYEVFAVNPRTSATDIAGATVFTSLGAIEGRVDMVDVFRPSGELLGVAQQAIAIGAKVLWAQLAIYDDAAAELAERAGLTVVMDRCPKIELPKLAL